MKKIKRIYHHCSVLEEHSMWATVKASKSIILSERARDLLSEPCQLKAAMVRVINEWPISCEHNLSCRSINRNAWLGRAACYIETDSVELTTRTGWNLLDIDEQIKANNVADKIIKEWELCQK